MSIRKEDLHQLVDLVKDRDTKIVYDLIKDIIEKDEETKIIVEADNSPLTDQEMKIIKEAEKDINNGDLIDWDDLHV